jgi:hypothetical protein
MQTRPIRRRWLRCQTARTAALNYLAAHRSAKRYNCRDCGSETKLMFRCTRGIHVVFAIRG